MTEKPRNPRAGTRGKPFTPGNPGRVAGSRNKATIAIEALLDGEAEALSRKAIELALEGDTVALRLCLERIAPPRKERPLLFELAPIGGVEDHPAAIASIFAAVASGDLMPSEATALTALLDHHRRSVETADHEARLSALEGKTGNEDR
jgi:hypothetical protein